MSNRRSRPANRFGCKPTEDVCVEHDRPLECPHGCKEAKPHKCAFKERPGYTPSSPRDIYDGDRK